MKHSFAKWWRCAPAWLGFSVDAQGMTLVEWCPTGRAPASATCWGQEKWPHGDAHPLGAWRDPAELGTEVLSLWQRSGMRCRRLAMGLPADRVVQQTLQVDADLPASEVRAQVNWSASQVLDLAWNDVAFDYRVENQGDASLHPRESLTVNWLACPMALVQAARQMSRTARLQLQFLGVEPVHRLPLEERLGGAPVETPVVAPELSPQFLLACEMARQGAVA